jgi:hypothetical protein
MCLNQLNTWIQNQRSQMKMQGSLCLLRWKSTDISEEYIASIFQGEGVSQATKVHEAGNEHSQE